MIKNHLKIALRFFVKNKLFTGINVLGLSIGITAFILLINYVAYERSYDAHLPDVEDLYRVTLTTNLGDNGVKTSATNHPAVGPAMLNDFPEVEEFTRIVDKSIAISGTVILSYTDEQGEKIKSDIKDDHVYLANNSIIKTFNLNLLNGDPASALTEPGVIMLSSSIAKRFFGDVNPIGKFIDVNDNQFSLRVTGVFEDAPLNSHLPLGMLISFATLDDLGDFTNSWQWPEFYTYVKLKSGTDPSDVESKFPSFVDKYLSDIMKTYGFEARFGLQHVSDIHLKSQLSNEISVNNSETTLYFLVIVAAFIIGIALINFINLSTAKSMERAKEVGIKKVIGAHRDMLIRQFLIESLLINLFAMILAIGFVSVFIPSFNTLVGFQVISIHIWLDPQVWLNMLIIVLVGGILAGLYPAFVLSDFIPVQILKGNFQNIGKGLVLRKTLVVAQFAISTALVAGTYIVYNQFTFMQSEELGFDASHNLVLPAPSYTDSITPVRVETFKEELLQHPNINNITFSNEIPGRPIEWHNSLRRSFEGIEQAASSGQFSVDHNFFKTYNIPVLAGRDFMREDASLYFDENGPVRTGHRVVINQTAARILGFQQPKEAVDELVVFEFGPGERTAQVIGVVDDHHQQSLQQSYEPIVFINMKGYNAVEYLTINVSRNVKENVAMIGEKYSSFFPNDVFKFFFMDEYFNRQYQAEDRFSKVFLWFSILAMFIAALGLFGLGSHTAMQKTREISVRKVLGANLGQALFIIPAKLLGLVLISGVITLPIVYFAAKSWLDGYAFNVGINIWMFIIPVLIVVFVAVLSIAVQSLKAALVNPADALRNN